jgi:hypothetical protein
MIAAALATVLAADPGALRAIHHRGPAVDWTTDGVGVASTIGPVRASLEYRNQAALTANVGWARPLVGAGRTWGIDTILGGGIGAVFASPGAVLTGIAELRAGARDRRRQATLGLVVPVAIRLDHPTQLALPLGLELRLALRLGPLWLGLRGQAGPTLSLGSPPSGHAAAGGFVQWAL